MSKRNPQRRTTGGADQERPSARCQGVPESGVRDWPRLGS